MKRLMMTVVALGSLGCGAALDVDETVVEEETAALSRSCDASGGIKIVPRSQWGARAARSGRPGHSPNRITIHHTVQGAISGPAAVRQVQGFHQNGNGWSDIGYHFLIDRDGTIYQGNPEGLVGAHVARQNTGNLGIALIGSFDKERLGSEQQRAAANLVAHLGRKYGISVNRTNVRGHGERMATACPGDIDLNELVRLAASGPSCGGTVEPDPVPTPTLDPIEVYWARNLDGSYKLHALAGARTQRVEYYVDDWKIGGASRADGANFPDAYRFTSETRERYFEVRGFDASGKQVSQGIGLMDVTDEVGVYIRQLTRDVFEIGLERAPEGVAAMEVVVDEKYLLTDSVSGQQRSNRAAVRSKFSGIGPRTFKLTTYNADGSVRGSLRRAFDLRGK